MQKKYAEKNREVKKSVRRDQRNWTDNLSYQAEEAASKGELKELYAITRVWSRKQIQIRSNGEGGGRNSSVGIATRYGLDNQGIESRWGRDFSAHAQTGPGAHPASYTIGTVSFPGVKRTGRDFNHPYLTPRLKKECSYSLRPR